MKTCPKCNKSNDDNNAKCCFCGADLQTINNDDATKDACDKSPSSDTTASNVSRNSYNSEKIENLAIKVGILGVIGSIILAFLFPSVTVSSGHYSSGYEYSFNWGLFFGGIIGSACLVIILVAMSYIAKAIEEK